MEGKWERFELFFSKGQKFKNLTDRFLTPPETLHIASPGLASALAEGVSQVLWVWRG